MKTKTIAFAAILIALNVIFTRYLSIQTEFLRISLGFLPVAVFSVLYGPLLGATAAAIGDIIGFLLFPIGMYFPGFTLSAFVYGLGYGLILHKKKITVFRALLANALVILFCDVLLGTIWLTMMGQVFEVIIIPRLIKALIALPIQVIIIILYEKFIGKRIKNQFRL